MRNTLVLLWCVFERVLELWNKLWWVRGSKEPNPFPGCHGSPFIGKGIATVAPGGGIGVLWLAGRGVVRRADQTDSTRFVYPGSGREDA